MSRRKVNKMNTASVAETKTTVGEKDERFIPDEKLQAFYNEAYIGERDRLNSMFGRIDTYPVVEEKIIYRDPDLTNYVPMKKYKKKCVTSAVLGILFALTAIGFAVYFLFKSGYLPL